MASRPLARLWQICQTWLSSLRDALGTAYPFVATLGLTAFGVLFALWLGSVVFRLVIIGRIANGFGVNLLLALPIAPSTAAVISSVFSTLALFSIDSILAFVLFGKNKARWRYTAGLVGALAIAASVYMNKDVIAGRCYVITPDKGLELSYADQDGQCGIDRATTLPTKPVTLGVILSVRAMKSGIVPTELDPTTLNPNAIFGASDGRSLLWIADERHGAFRLFNAAGFDPASQTPLSPVTPENASQVREFIRAKISEAEETKKINEEAARVRLQDERERAAKLRNETETLPQAGVSLASSTDVTPTRQNPSAGPAQVVRQPCLADNTGNFIFKNNRTKLVTIWVGSFGGPTREVVIPAGTTQTLLNYSAGAHDYEVRYKALEPLAPFPPGAPLVERDVLHSKGQILVRQCQSDTLEIR